MNYSNAAPHIRSFLVDCGTKGWDSYDAEPIIDEVVERSCNALAALNPVYTFWPVPCSDGGILFEGIDDWDGIDFKVEP